MADDGERGVALVESFRPDIILLDIQMPRMNGVEALTEIRKYEWGKNLPVLILTNLGEEEAPNELKELGVIQYIVKADLTPKQVVEKVKVTLAV